MDKDEQFTTAIVCGKCGQEGDIVWERTEGRTKRIFFRVSDGFYRSIRGRHSAEPSIICDDCGAVLKSHALSIAPPGTTTKPGR
jgi:hypothetical protein